MHFEYEDTESAPVVDSEHSIEARVRRIVVARLWLFVTGDDRVPHEFCRRGFRRFEKSWREEPRHVARVHAVVARERRGRGRARARFERHEQRWIAGAQNVRVSAQLRERIAARD